MIRNPNSGRSWWVFSQILISTLFVADNTNAAALYEEYLKLKLSLYLNIAAVQLLSGNHKAVIENCTKVLKIDPGNSKALYRRGVAHSRNKDVYSAKRDLLAALKIEPNDGGIRKELRELAAPWRWKFCYKQAPSNSDLIYLFDVPQKLKSK